MAPKTKEDIESRVREVIGPILNSMNLELVELELAGQGPRAKLRLFIEKPGGVTLADCEQASRFIGHALDVADPFPGSYTLEVSSPGLDRPLRGAEDYRRFAGRLARLKLVRPLEGEWTVVGRIQGLEGERILLEVKDRGRLEVGLADVAQGRLEVEW